MWRSMGSTNAIVLPDPVFATPMQSRPLMMIGSACKPGKLLCEITAGHVYKRSNGRIQVNLKQTAATHCASRDFLRVQILKAMVDRGAWHHVRRSTLMGPEVTMAQPTSREGR